jgi:molybdate transport system ATP-binding protein
MSVRRNLLYGASWPRSGQGKLGLKQVADLLAIGHLLPRRPDKLSGGERRRVALGRALLSGPRLLLLDEPLTGLDMGLRGRILPFLGKIHRTLGLPILLVSHELMDVLELTDHLMVLREGQLLGTGRLIDLVRDPGILPLLHRMGLQNVLHLEVVGQDRTDEVTICRPAGSQGPWEAPTGRIFLPLLDASAGERISVSLPARSITLGLLPADDLSIQNRLSARIVELIRAPGRCVCILETAGQKLLAEVTLRAVRELSLRPGQWIWCLFKSHSLRLLPA